MQPKPEPIPPHKLPHRDMVRRWLQSKGQHPADIAKALEWYDYEVRVGATPTDHAVLEKSHEYHASKVESYSIAPPPTPGRSRLYIDLEAAASGAIAALITTGLVAWVLALTR